MSPKLSSHSLAMLLGWLSVQPRKQTGLIAKTPKGHGMMGLSHTGPMCTGAGVWDLEGHVSQGGGGGGRQKCNPHRRFLQPRTQGSWRWGQQTKGDASGHRLWHCTLLYLCQVLLVPHPSKAGLGRDWAQISGALPGSAVNIHEAISLWVPQFPPNKELPFQA